MVTYRSGARLSVLSFRSALFQLLQPFHRHHDPLVSLLEGRQQRSERFCGSSRHVMDCMTAADFAAPSAPRPALEGVDVVCNVTKTSKKLASTVVSEVAGQAKDKVRRQCPAQHLLQHATHQLVMQSTRVVEPAPHQLSPWVTVKPLTVMLPCFPVPPGYCRCIHSTHTWTANPLQPAATLTQAWQATPIAHPRQPQRNARRLQAPCTRRCATPTQHPAARSQHSRHARPARRVAAQEPAAVVTGRMLLTPPTTPSCWAPASSLRVCHPPSRTSPSWSCLHSLALC